MIFRLWFPLINHDSEYHKQTIGDSTPADPGGWYRYMVDGVRTGGFRQIWTIPGFIGFESAGNPGASGPGGGIEVAWFGSGVRDLGGWFRGAFAEPGGGCELGVGASERELADSS